MASAPGSNRALAVLALALLLAMAPWFTTAAILAPLRVEWRLTGSQAAWLTIAAQMGFVAGALASALANLADLIRPRWLMLAGGLAAAGVNALLAHCHSFGAAWPSRFATGACLALVYPPALKLMATWFRSGRGTALGIMVGALTVGAALPHLVSGVSAAGWRGVVIATSWITAAGGLLGGFAGKEGPFSFGRARFDVREIVQVFSNRGVRLATFGYLGHMWEMIAMWSWLGAYMAAQFARAGVDASTAAVVTFLAIGAGGLGCWRGGVRSDRGGREQAALLALAISGGCALCLGWIPASNRLLLCLVIAISLVWGFWVVADSAQFSTLVTELSDARYVGTALTSQLGLGFTLASVTVWLIPWILQRGGWGWAFLALAPGPIVGIVAMSRLMQIRRPVAASARGR